MKATQCSLQTVLSAAKKDEDIALVLSFLQVEFGLAELQANWDGFVDSSEHYEITYKSRKDVANQFAGALVDLYELHDYAQQMA